YNMMATPAGRQYSLTLADGTRVWLNASSSISFPTVFGNKKREVSITGEVYFEVAPVKTAPFVVKHNGNIEVEVLGTHFNINSYDNEATPRTTLLEGKVKVKFQNSTSILKPGEQASLNKEGNISIASNVDLEEVMAWKNGMFQFDNTAIDAVMRQLARWYDVEIEYRGAILKHFGGNISRDVNLSQVLKILELTGEVKFRIEGKKIIATPA
ncbi:MAG: FecR domain-containing protein, partial [Flavitalea sp.]